MELPRQEYWNGLPFPSPGDLPNPEIEPMSPESAAGGFFTAEQPGKPRKGMWMVYFGKYWGVGAPKTFS